MDNLFDEFTRGDSEEVSQSSWLPSVDITENNNQYIIHAEIPGMSKKDIKITMGRNNGSAMMSVSISVPGTVVVTAIPKTIIPKILKISIRNIRFLSDKNLGLNSHFNLLRRYTISHSILTPAYAIINSVQLGNGIPFDKILS